MAVTLQKILKCIERLKIISLNDFSHKFFTFNFQEKGYSFNYILIFFPNLSEMYTVIVSVFTSLTNFTMVVSGIKTMIE